ncbi:MAG TPA: hypothetical protein PKK60_03450 [archaeon]|nr:hypothetical protein [archaeon]
MQQSIHKKIGEYLFIIEPLESKDSQKYSFYLKKGNNVVAYSTICEVRNKVITGANFGYAAGISKIQRTIAIDLLTSEFEKFFRKKGITRTNVRTNPIFARFLEKRGWQVFYPKTPIVKTLPKTTKKPLALKRVKRK